MCEQCEVLREENLQLRDMLFGAETQPDDEIARVLTRRQQVLYRVLQRWPIAAHDVLAAALIEASTKGENLEDPRRLVAVQICKMRKRLAPLGIKIETIWGIGFRLIREAA